MYVTCDQRRRYGLLNKSRLYIYSIYSRVEYFFNFFIYETSRLLSYIRISEITRVYYYYFRVVANGPKVSRRDPHVQANWFVFVKFMSFRETMGKSFAHGVRESWEGVKMWLEINILSIGFTYRPTHTQTTPTDIYIYNSYLYIYIQGT